MKNITLLLFITILAIAALACSAVLPAENSATGELSEQEIVDRVAATVTARLEAEGIGSAVSAASERVVIESELEQQLESIYARVNPSVVYVITEQSALDLGSGSGFVYDAEGHIVTNNHVVSQGDGFEVVFWNGSRRRAEVVGTDVDSDLAVIKVDSLPSGIGPVPLGDFEDLRVGQFVIAIGNPFEEQGSMSLGIVSNLGRTLTSQRFAENGGTYSLPEVIQTDAPINPGNSGGPLLNLEGEVIGVNSAIRSNTGFNSGVGFAIPVAAVRRVVPALISEGSYSYPYIGIGTSGGAIDLDRAELLELPQASGVYVTSVTPGSPADDAGVVAAPSATAPGGDLIVSIDGREVKDFSDLISYLTFETVVGQTIELQIIRDGEQTTVPITLTERP